MADSIFQIEGRLRQVEAEAPPLKHRDGISSQQGEDVSEQDHYEVLGIRPSAGHDEIELAYKGRRSQYHPDRYSQADAETQAWATDKMQQVNEAYRVLTNAGSRADFDRRRPSSGGRQQPPAQEPVQQATSHLDPAAVLLNPKWEWFHDKVYAKPNIPPRKLEGAISSYAHNVAPHEVLVLLDDTLFGGAKEGVLVTNEAIYCKKKFEHPKRIAMKAIREVEPGSHSRIFINGNEFFKADLVDHLAVLTFASRLSRVFKSADSPRSDPRPSKSPERTSGIESLQRIHRDSLHAVRAAFDGDAALIDDLIDRQMKCIVGEYSNLRIRVETDGRSNRTADSDDAACAELALLLVLVLHFHGFSLLPSELRGKPDDEFVPVLGVTEVYHDRYRELFQQVFGCVMELDEESMLTMSLVFYEPEGAPGAAEMNVPRKEAVRRLLTQMGMSEEVSNKLIRQAEQNAKSWLAPLLK